MFEGEENCTGGECLKKMSGKRPGQ